jgi:hypothetical protein
MAQRQISAPEKNAFGKPGYNAYISRLGGLWAREARRRSTEVGMGCPKHLPFSSQGLGFSLGWVVCLQKQVDGASGNHASVGLETRLHFKVVEIAVETL